MTDWVRWFQTQLQASADGFVWAFAQINPEQWHRLPPDASYMGTWTPLRHVWHVTGYEEMIVVPAMQAWCGQPMPDGEKWQDDDDAFAAALAAGLTADAMIARFRAVRQQQIDLLDELTSIDWEAPRPTLWGNQPLKMVVTKTYQHTFEHGDTLLRMALWWKENDTMSEAQRLLDAGEEALLNHDLATARLSFTQSQALFHTAGAALAVLYGQHCLGKVALAEGNLGQARAIQEEVLRHFQEQHFSQGVAEVHQQLGLVAMKEGNPAEARAHLTEALQLWRTIGKKKESEAAYTLLMLLPA